MERPLFSDVLAERRRQLGYSIRQASRVLRLREDILIAFEEGDFEQMPKSGYAQGMISSYARYLGLDANEVVSIYADDYERYRRESRYSRGSGRGQRSRGQRSGEVSGSAQPYVASRGLLPTSGGPAGDMGSFATTRVHTRGASYAERDDEDEQAERDEYLQSRPYTNRATIRSKRAYRSSAASGRGGIETMGVDGYDDDLRIGRDARPYESASTRSGRRSSRGTTDSRRPRVNRRSQNPGREPDRDGRGRTSRRNRRQQGVIASLLGGGSSSLVLVAVIAVILIISLVIVFSVSTCVRQGTESVRTVPVSSAADNSKETEQQESQSTEQDSIQTTATNDAQSSDTSTSTTSGEKETSVSVSVADGAVTWLEVECDGESDVAQTVTGPWQKTYTVEDAISIQAGDTTAVSVVQNGRQVQFESMASGIGSVRIQGTKTKTGKSKDSQKGDDSSSDSTSAKTGNASSTTSESTEEDSNAESGYQDQDTGESYGDYEEEYVGY